MKVKLMHFLNGVEIHLLSRCFYRRQHPDKMLQLLKQQIDRLVVSQEQLQAFLIWVSQKSRAVPCAYKPVIVRAFYLDLALARILGRIGGSLDLALKFDRTLTRNLERHMALDLALDRALALDLVIAISCNPNLVCEQVLERAISHARTLEPMLEMALLQLKQQLPSQALSPEGFKQWWSIHGGAWTEQLRSVTIKYRHLGHNWQLSHQQRETMKQYYDANCWLVDYLNSDCYMSEKVRAFTERALLLPSSEIELPLAPD